VRKCTASRGGRTVYSVAQLINASGSPCKVQSQDTTIYYTILHDITRYWNGTGRFNPSTRTMKGLKGCLCSLVRHFKCKIRCRQWTLSNNRLRHTRWRIVLKYYVKKRERKKLDGGLGRRSLHFLDLSSRRSNSIAPNEKHPPLRLAIHTVYNHPCIKIKLLHNCDSIRRYDISSYDNISCLLAS